MLLLIGMVWLAVLIDNSTSRASKSLLIRAAALKHATSTSKISRTLSYPKRFPGKTGVRTSDGVG